MSHQRTVFHETSGDSLMTDSGSTRRPRGSLWRWVWALCVLVVMVAGVGWIVLHPRAAPPPGGRFSGNGAMPVVVTSATKGDIEIELKALGTVTAPATVTVKTQIGGQMTQVAFTEGQTVHAGDFLAQIDSRPYELALAQLQGQLRRDQALLAAAKVDLARYQKLVSEDSIARQQLDTQVSLVQQYEGTVETDVALINNAKLNIAYCHIVSPLTGRVGLRQVDPGNYVQTSDPNGIVMITQMQPITVIAAVPEDNLPAILKRLHDGATLPVTAWDRSDSTKLATGVLLTLDNQIDTSTGTIKLRARFDNQDQSLFPNQFVNIRVLVNVVHDATIIPTVAIQRGVPGTFVYLAKPDNTVTVRPVRLGAMAGDKVAVLDGLALGDRVVIDGADKLREGVHITVPAETAAAPAAPAAPATTTAATPATPATSGASDSKPGDEHHHHHRSDQ
jgi:multidrug efflux system membrane fusion protein